MRNKTLLLLAVVAMLLPNVSANAQNELPAFDMKRCVNMGNSFERPKDGDWGGPLLLENFSKIKGKGFDTVRIPVRWSDYTGPAPDFKIDSEFIAQVDDAVTEALEQDLNVILNVHHFEEIMENPQKEFRKLAAMWRQIATHFASRSDDLWFETLNEPNNKLEGELMRAAKLAAVLVIRENNPSRSIILGGDGWSNIRSLPSNIKSPDDDIV